MPVNVKQSDELLAEYGSRIDKIAEENPDLPYDFIKDILLAREEQDFEEYKFD